MVLRNNLWSLLTVTTTLSHHLLFTASAFSSRRLLFRSSLVGAVPTSSRLFSAAKQSMTGVERRPYGAWESPITSESITTGSVKLGGLHICDNVLYWLEGRPQEGGRYALCRYLDGDKTEEVSPKEMNVRTRVHEYGGGAVVFGSNANEIYGSEFTSQQLVQIQPDTDGTTTQAVTPETEQACQYRFADGVLINSDKIVCIREDHTNPEPKHVVNQVVSIDLSSSEDNNNNNIQVLATGNDFYSNPRVSPDGTQLAYLTWNHPNMPWDAVELRVANMNDDNKKTLSHDLIAGSDGDTSILQPLWHPQSGALYYLSDTSGYYNLYRAGREESVLPMPHDWGGAAPGWGLGQQAYQFLPDGRLVATYTKAGKSVLLIATLPDDNGPATDIHEYGMDDGLPMQFGGVVCDTRDNLYFLGGSPSTPTSIFQWNFNDKGPAKQLVCSSTLSFEEGIISVPEQIEFPTTGGQTAFGYYYPPKNCHYQPVDDQETPPLLVKAHGGPTACTGTSFNANIQFWTSRGFAILDVDYGGSTGYGREYRRRLRNSWGIVDIDDVCAGAQYLVQQNKADGKRLCIDGGSAGGYTTLGALAFRDVFSAGCSLYGVGDLTALAGDTHKFESRYLDGLVGKYPEDEAIYKERSPIESVDKLSCPILILQGDEDKIVPPNQAEMMHEALLKKGIPTCLKMYKGEQHGFRKAENIQDALDSELAFYGKVFGIEVPGAVDLKIDNM